jgi:hypothetical protein
MLLGGLFWDERYTSMLAGVAGRVGRGRISHRTNLILS